jgi:ABC-type glycerol-3-phosphate transport system substrate-binding protein
MTAPFRHWFGLIPPIAALLGCAVGCDRPTKPVVTSPQNHVAQPLRLIVVDDPALAAAIKRQWLAHTESELQVTDLTAEQAEAAQHLPGDVVIYPPALVGQFAVGDMLLPLDESLLAGPEYERAEILPTLLSSESSWGRRLMAVPLGSPQLVLFYRSDLLEPAKLGLPKTWEEYANLVAHFERPPGEIDVAEDDWLPAVEPLAEGWPSRLLLARAAAGARHRDQISSLWNSDMAPLIAGPPWVRALEQLRATQGQSKNRKLLTPRECLTKFLAAECAFAITWPQDIDESSQVKLKPEQVGQMLLPGSKESYDTVTTKWEPISAGEAIQVQTLSLSGRVASVCRASSQPAVARRFLLWLSGPVMSGKLAPESAATTVFRLSHFRSSDTWQASPQVARWLPAYGELLAQADQHPRKLFAPRLPGQQEYLAALDQAVLAVVQGGQPAADALQQVASQWRQITDRRDIAQQQRALRQSLGLAE